MSRVPGRERAIDTRGILVDACTQCGGVWLDRQALEQLASFMSGVRAGEAAPAQARQAGRARHRDDDDDDDDDDEADKDNDDERARRRKYPEQRRRSILDLFD